MADMTGKIQPLEEVQKNFHVLLQSHLTIKNYKIEVLQDFYQRFAHTERF